jgi:uncharacterized membrane protein
MNLKNILSTLLEVLGIAAVVLALFIVAPTLGLLALGMVVFLAGFLIDGD